MKEIKNTVIDTKNVFDGLSRLDAAEERISEFEDLSIETSRAERQRENRMEKLKENVQELGANYRRGNIFVMRTLEYKERKNTTDV